MQERNDYRSRARQNNPFAQQDDAPSYSNDYSVPSTTNLIGGGGGGRTDDLASLNQEVHPDLHIPAALPLTAKG